MYLKRKGMVLLNSIIIMLTVILIGSITAKIIFSRGEMLKIPQLTNAIYEFNPEIINSIDLINNKFSNEELKKIINTGDPLEKGNLKLEFLSDEDKYIFKNEIGKEYSFAYDEEIPCKCNDEDCIVSKEKIIIIKPNIEVIHD